MGRIGVIKMNAILFTFWLFVVFPSFAAQQDKWRTAAAAAATEAVGAGAVCGRKDGGSKGRGMVAVVMYAAAVNSTGSGGCRFG